jgi:DNA-binding transcriptional MerR regulator
MQTDPSGDRAPRQSEDDEGLAGAEKPPKSLSTSQLSRLLGVSSSVVRTLTKEGYLEPSMGSGRALYGKDDALKVFLIYVELKNIELKVAKNLLAALTRGGAQTVMLSEHTLMHINMDAVNETVAGLLEAP